MLYMIPRYQWFAVCEKEAVWDDDDEFVLSDFEGHIDIDPAIRALVDPHPTAQFIIGTEAGSWTAAAGDIHDETSDPIDVFVACSDPALAEALQNDFGAVAHDPADGGYDDYLDEDDESIMDGDDE